MIREVILRSIKEIKFRAWDSDAKKMITKNSYVLRVMACNPNCPNFHVMQFTGLSDKNGVAIYEGDILYSEKLGYIPVTWWNEMARFWAKKQNHFLHPDKAWKNVTIVGNIYGNPELLEGNPPQKDKTVYNHP